MSLLPRLARLSLLPLLLIGASSCAPSRLSPSTAEERSFGRSVDDTSLKTNILGLFAKSDIKGLLSNVTVRVYEARVYLFGQVFAQESADEAYRLAWLTKGVREVVNDIQVGGPDTNFGDAARDTRIETQIEAKLKITKGIKSANYTVEAFNTVVYLIGTAVDQRELDAVSQIARTTAGVTKVVSHVRLKDDPNNLSGR